MSSSKTAVLLLNLGTPRSPSIKDVAKYLRTFLNDSRVIELPAILRWVLVNCFIVPFRARKSAHAYAQIWQDNGSPLLLNSLELKNALARTLGQDYHVSLGMTYGYPKIADVMQEFANLRIEKMVILPLFPQYSSAASGAPVQQVLDSLAKAKNIPAIVLKNAYYQDANFIRALAESIKPYLGADFEYLLLSYHGLPERQDIGANPYSAQCYKTADLVARELELATNEWSVAFQSRLGRLPWIKPYTEEVLLELRARGIKVLHVACPSFAVDCLETLEEIGVRARELWKNLGGEDLILIPCLNAQPQWVKALESMLRV